MAEDVFDSWEDMIDENGVLDKKLSDLKIVDSTQQMRPIMSTHFNSNSNMNSSISSSNDSVWPSIGSNNTFSNNLNAVKILKRPTNKVSLHSAFGESVNDKNPNHLSIQPIASVGPQITLEDNTRTQYVPQVRILKRPNAKDLNESSDKSMASLERKSMNANRSQSNNKTYEEREAEYAKARLRILGSASAQEENSSSPELCQLSNCSTGYSSSSSSSSSGTNSNTLSPTNSASNKSNNTPISSTKLGSLNCYIDSNNVPIIRLPQGPDGSKGFNHHKR